MKKSILFKRILTAALLCVFMPSADFSYSHFRYKRSFKINHSMEIFDRCFSDKQNAIVYIGNASSLSLKSKHWSFNLKVLQELSDAWEIARLESIVDSYIKSNYSYKLQAASKFFISEINLSSLNLALLNLKYSIWWNVYGFFVIEKFDTPNGCSEAYDHLKIAWNLHILNAVFLCFDNDLEVQMYTFNPYNEKMTNRWSDVQKFVQDNGHPITVFKYKFPSKSFSSFICNDLLIDKTLSLSGYPITISSSKINFVMHHEPLVTVSSRISREIWNFLKVKVCFKTVPGSFEVNEYGNPQGSSLIDLLYGKYDMKYTFDFERRFFWRYELNTYIPGGICYVTKKSEYFSFSEDLTSILSPGEFAQVFLMGVIVTALVSRLLRLDFGQVALNAVRAIIGVAILHSPKSIIPRIVFIHVVIYSMVLNSYFQSHLSLSMVTGHERVKIESPADLTSLGYKTFARNATHQYFSYWPGIYYQIHEWNSLRQCIEAIEVDDKICCTDDCHKVWSRVDSREYQVSEDMHLRWNYVFTFQRDHPLLPRIRQVYARLYQSGFIAHLMSGIHPKSKDSYGSLRKISFREVKKAFYFITIGQIAGTLVFFTEVFVNFVLTRKLLNMWMGGMKRVRLFIRFKILQIWRNIRS